MIVLLKLNKSSVTFCILTFFILFFFTDHIHTHTPHTHANTFSARKKEPLEQYENMSSPQENINKRLMRLVDDESNNDEFTHKRLNTSDFSKADATVNKRKRADDGGSNEGENSNKKSRTDDGI